MSKHPTLRTTAAVLLTLAMPALMGAEGGCTLIQDSLDSPVHAVTTLLERADGTVEAEVVIISTEGPGSQFVDSAENVQMRVPSGAIVDLQPAQPGRYAETSDDDSRLVYDPEGGNYRITFDLDDAEVAGDAAGEEFIAVVAAPDGDVSFEFTKLPEFAGDTSSISWSPAQLEGLLEVRDPGGNLVFTSFDLSHPDFDGSKWASLLHGGKENLRVDVFAEPGTYTVSFCAVQSQEGLDEELSAGLGIFSGFFAGRCAEDVTIDVPE